MNNDLIRYDVLVKEALREVIKKVLTEVSKAGLPGDHHFFITFCTNANGVKISSQLKKQYPDNMTIVIQHQFWDLNVYENYFEISLSFNNIAENLVIPFAAIQCFYDPCASFEAAFSLQEILHESNNEKSAKSNDTKKKITKNIKLTTEKPNEDQIKENNKAKIISIDDFRKK